MSAKRPKSKNSVEACESILAILKASQRQLEYLAHEHLDFSQVLALEEKIRVGGSPERAEIQRFRLLLDARLDHVRQLRALTSLAPLTFTPSDKARIERLQEALKLVEQEADQTQPETGAPTHAETSSAKDEVPPSDTLSLTPENNETPVAEPKEDITTQSATTSEPVEEALTKTEDIQVDTTTLAREESTVAPDDTSRVEPLAAAPTEAAIPLGGGSSTASSSNPGLSLQVTTSPTVPESSPKPSTPALDHDLKLLMRVATKAHGDGELENAIDAYSDLLDQQPEHLPALLARGRCHLEKKDYTAAVSDFRRAQSLDKHSTGALVALGDLYFARKNHDQAITFFDQAIDLESNHAQARCRRGLAHYHSGRYRQAFLDLQRAYKLDPEIPNIRRLVQMAIRKLEENA